jgi:hypothetical protein
VHESAAKQDSENESAANQYSTSELAWKGISAKVWDYENNRIDGWNKQIDTLLVFVSSALLMIQALVAYADKLQAGLFSAVVTAFNVQYYTSLQPPSGTQVMLRVPSDLTYPIHVSTLPSAVTSDAAVAATTVVINTLWFLALVLSLSAASIGITVKQWLSSYIPPSTMTSRQRTRLWNHRQCGLRKWRVPAIVSVLPNLLQLALLLFLVGLVVLLWTLNRVSAIVVMIPVVILMILLGITSIIPTFVPQCPYKSPQAWWIYLILYHVTCSFKRFVSAILSNTCSVTSFVQGSLLPSVTHSVKEFVLNPRSVILSWIISLMFYTVSLPGLVHHYWAWIPWGYSMLHQITVFGAPLHPDVTGCDWLDRDNNWLHASLSSAWKPGPAVETVNMIIAADSVVRDDAFLQDVIAPAFSVVTDLDAQEFKACLAAFYQLVQSRATRVYRRVNDTHNSVAPMFRDDMDSGLAEAMAEVTQKMPSVYFEGSGFVPQQRRVLSILHALLAALPESRSRVLIQLINWYCHEPGAVYGPSNARKDDLDLVEWISRRAVRDRSTVQALPGAFT